jgi:hypothetical protein
MTVGAGTQPTIFNRLEFCIFEIVICKKHQLQLRSGLSKENNCIIPYYVKLIGVFNLILYTWLTVLRNKNFVCNLSFISIVKIDLISDSYFIFIFSVLFELIGTPLAGYSNRAKPSGIVRKIQ